MTLQHEYYQPDTSALPDGLGSVKLLSQRDVALHIPINFVPVSGISLSTCVVGLRYDLSVLKCFSNLLVVGFRRFDVDIYWDDSQNLWTLCPVQLDVTSASTLVASSTPTTSSSGPAVTAVSSLASTPANAAIAARIKPAHDVQNMDDMLAARQALTTSASLPSSASLTLARATPAASASASSSSIVQLGRYTCSPDLDVNALLSVLVSHLALTESNLNATTNYLTLNLHAARADPAAPASTPTSLPGNDRALGTLLSGNASDYIYTPANLQLQRANLNATGSWYNVPADVLPDSSYFNVTQQDSTPNGWPSESFVEFTKFRRLLVSFGEIQPEMAAYNVSADAGTIFQPGYITSNYSYNLNADGSLQSGCFYKQSTTDLQAVNNSWAVGYTEEAAALAILNQANNLTACGFTSVLTSTLNNITAADNPSTYRNFVLASIWSWDSDEPDPNGGHCAVLNATSGRWQANGCSAAHHCACDTGTPYGWQISNQQLSYDRTDQACPTGTTFGVSRTALENSHLINAWRLTRASNSIADELLWVNLNDISVPGCWVEGQNTTCPYQPKDDDSNREIVVPTVSGVIILVLTVLTIIVKCGSNRQASRRRRRRGGESIEYEGVPS